MNKVLVLAALAASMLMQPVFAQRKLIEKFLSNKADSIESRETSYMVVPAFSYAQETGLELGGATLISFYTSGADTLTRSSFISGKLTFTTKKQLNISVNPDVWTAGNRYHYSGSFRYKNFPFQFYGIGNSTLKENEDLLTQKLFMLSAAAERKLFPAFYAGISASFEHHSYVDREPGGIYSRLDDAGREGGKVLFIGLSAIFDNRDNASYTTKGSFAKLNYGYGPGLFGDGSFSGSQWRADMKHFADLQKKLVLGLNARLQSVQGKSIPFYLLPQLGNDEMMRGYYTGRYREQNLIAAQAELRYRFMHRFGAAAFAGTGAVFKNGDLRLRDFKPNYGLGMRYFVVPSRGLSIRADYGIGEKRRGEERQKGLYISLSEAF